eukprot:scaffold175_cov177-Amphora_coffeaeformis.AAC.15
MAYLTEEKNLPKQTKMNCARRLKDSSFRTKTMKGPRLLGSLWTLAIMMCIIGAAWIPRTVSFAPSSVKHFYLTSSPPERLGSAKHLSTRLFEQTRVNNEGNSRSPIENLNLLQKQNPSAPPGWLRTKFPKFPWKQVPNWLTYARCAAIPILMWAFYLPGRHILTSSIFAAASLTDYLDGYLARRWDASSKFGSFLDPVADKLMVSTALILLSGRYGMYLAIPASIILARELAVSALREWMAQIGARDTVKVGWQGKCKTALTMVALTILLAVPSNVPSTAADLVRLLLPAGLSLTYAATVLTMTSGWVYFAAAAPYLMETAKSDETS